MTLSHSYSNNWRHLSCESCLKNSHKEERMVLKRVFSTNDESKFSELYVCSKCGFTRRL